MKKSPEPGTIIKLMMVLNITIADAFIMLALLFLA